MLTAFEFTRPEKKEEGFVNKADNATKIPQSR